ncbi:hypothetical protein NUM3379_42290 [Kineococcus sp. NUM-3379]
MSGPSDWRDGRGSGPVRVAVAGAHGFGAVHLRNIARLEAEGLVRLVAVADPNPPGPGAVGDGVGVYADLTALLAEVPADVVVVSTPIHTHAALAAEALRAGADVLLEKPPVASAAEFGELLAVVAETGRRCQVGFQSLGGGGLDELARVLARGELGEVVRIGGTGTWVRPLTYWQRSRWAGRRTLDGVEVVDGVVTNPLAHAVATALRIAGARTAQDVASVETDLYRVNDVECDDTSTVRVTTTSGTVILMALTLCARTQTPPVVSVQGTRGRAVLHYTSDVLELHPDRAEPVRGEHPRRDLLVDLVERRADGGPLVSGLEDSGAFMRVLEAVRTAPDPRRVGGEFVVWVEDEVGRHPVLRDVEHWIGRAVAEGRTFSELGAPWAAGQDPAPVPQPGVLLEMRAQGRLVGTYVDGSEAVPSSGPRPYLHPARTPAGTVVTDAHPDDHDWHLGAGVALQHVRATAGPAAAHGWNFWGGRTWVRGTGYVWREDHGRQVHTGFRDVTGSSAVQDVRWRTADGDDVLAEERTWAWSAGNAGEVRFSRLDLRFRLAPAGEFDVELGSPGSGGRAGGGYGGFTWRLPPCRDVHVRTATAAGEDAVHGTRAPWLAWSATFGAEGPGGPDATLVFAPLDGASAADPWLVRVAGHPGVGSALAWEEPLLATRAEPVERGFRVLLADGRLDDAQVADLLRRAGS